MTPSVPRVSTTSSAQSGLQCSLLHTLIPNSSSYLLQPACFSSFRQVSQTHSSGHAAHLSTHDLNVLSPQPPTHSQECELSPYTRDKRPSVLKSLPISVSFPTVLPTTSCSYPAHLSQTHIRKQSLVLKHADPPPGKSRPIFTPPSPPSQCLI